MPTTNADTQTLISGRQVNDSKIRLWTTLGTGVIDNTASRHGRSVGEASGNSNQAAAVGVVEQRAVTSSASMTPRASKTASAHTPVGFASKVKRCGVANGLVGTISDSQRRPLRRSGDERYTTFCSWPSISPEQRV